MIYWISLEKQFLKNTVLSLLIDVEGYNFSWRVGCVFEIHSYKKQETLVQRDTLGHPNCHF